MSIEYNMQKIKTKDEILLFEYQLDYQENVFEPQNDKVQFFDDQFDHKYRGRQIVLIVELIEKDHVQRRQHVQLNKNSFIIHLF